jgi:acetamidase/formamidase
MMVTNQKNQNYIWECIWPAIILLVVRRLTGGNLDGKELIVGSTLYLPIEVTGGLF